MIPLHTIPEILDQPIEWFGHRLACRDGYHAGYPSERTDPQQHSGCAANRFMERGFTDAGSSTFWCECQVCRRADRNHSHYYHRRPNDFRPDASSRRDVTTRNANADLSDISLSDAHYVCDHCVANQHPTPPEGQI